MSEKSQKCVFEVQTHRAHQKNIIKRQNRIHLNIIARRHVKILPQYCGRIRKFRVLRDFRRKYPEYKCYIAAGSDIDLVADTDGDHMPSDGYNDGRAHVKVVTFLHQRVFRPKALVVDWHKNGQKKALEHLFFMDAFCGLM